MGIICLYLLIQKSGQKTAKSHLCAVDHFDKKTAWSLIYFLKYAYLNIEPIRKFW